MKKPRFLKTIPNSNSSTNIKLPEISDSGIAAVSLLTTIPMRTRNNQLIKCSTQQQLQQQHQ